MGEVVQFPARSQPAESEPMQPTTEESRPVRSAPDWSEPLWRESIGHELRKQRAASGRRLVDVAGDAGVSPQYLSEVERGLKDPSSEILAAMAGALGLSIADLASRVASSVTSSQAPLCMAA
jgi:hypothetical protein